MTFVGNFYLRGAEEQMVNSSTPASTYYFDKDNSYYQIPFEFESNGDLKVIITNADHSRTELQLVSDYEVVNGNSIRIISPEDWTDAAYLTVIRTGTISQEFSFSNGTYLDVTKIEKALDLMALWLQEMKLQLDNTFVAAPEDLEKRISILLPSVDERKGKIMYWKEDGITLGLSSFEELSKVLEAVQHSKQLAREWAVKMDGKVDEDDYSSKYYADEAKKYVEDGKKIFDNIGKATEESMKKLEEHTEELLKIRMAFQTTIGDGSSKEFVVEHNFNTFNFLIQIWSASEEGPSIWQVQKIDKNTIKITFEEAPQEDGISVVMVSIDEAVIPAVEWENVQGVVITPEQISSELAMNQDDVLEIFNSVF